MRIMVGLIDYFNYIQSIEKLNILRLLIWQYQLVQSYLMEGENKQQKTLQNIDKQAERGEEIDHVISQQTTHFEGSKNQQADRSTQNVKAGGKNTSQKQQIEEKIQVNKEMQGNTVQNEQIQTPKAIEQKLEEQSHTNIQKHQEPLENCENTQQLKKQQIQSQKIQEPIENQLSQDVALTKDLQAANKTQQIVSKGEQTTNQTQQKQISPEKPASGQTEHDQQSNMFISPTSKNQTDPAMNYGNNYVLYKNKYFFITIGPDYICFIPTFIFFCFISFLLISFINHNVESVIVKIITYIVCIGQCVSYLILALCDPGIARPISSSEKALIKTSFCRKCRFDVPKHSYHCSYCDVCILGYDHHCPWTSKCVGKRNLIKFYVFLFMTPIYIVYCAFAFGFTIQSNDKLHHNLRTVIPHKL